MMTRLVRRRSFLWRLVTTAVFVFVLWIAFTAFAPAVDIAIRDTLNKVDAALCEAGVTDIDLSDSYDGIIGKISGVMDSLFKDSESEEQSGLEKENEQKRSM